MVSLSDEQQDVLLHLMQMAKQHGAQAEASLTMDQGFHLEARCGDVDALEYHKGQSLGFSLYHEQRVAHVDATDISKASADALFEKALSLASYTQVDSCSGLAPADRMLREVSDLGLLDHAEVSTAQAIDKALQCESIALSLDKRIDQVESVSASHFDACHAYANTHDVLLNTKSSLHSMGCSVIAKEESGGMQRDSDYTRSRFASKLETEARLAELAVNATVSRLGARSIPTGQYPIIFDRQVAKSLIQHFTGAISGSRLYQQASFLCDKLGDSIFPSGVTIEQRPHILGGMGSSLFDGDGVCTKDISYIDQGVLSSYALGHYSAKRLGMSSTGNAGGLFNCVVNMPTQSHDDLLKQMGTGLLITEVMGQGVNIVTGDYSRGAFGYWVENGVIQHAVHEITIASTLQQMFQGFVAMADDVDTRGNIRTGSILIDQMQVAA